MPFDLPSNFSNGTDYIPVDSLNTFIQYANYASGGYLGIAFLIVIFVVVASVGIMTGVKKSLLAASFITFIFSVYFWALSMCPTWVVFLLVIVMIVMALGVKEESNM